MHGFTVMEGIKGDGTEQFGRRMGNQFTCDERMRSGAVKGERRRGGSAENKR